MARVSLLKETVILIISVTLSCTCCNGVDVTANYTYLFDCVLNFNQVCSSDFSQLIADVLESALFLIKNKKRMVMETEVDYSGGPGTPAARKKQKIVPSPEEKEEKKNRRGEVLRRMRQERRLYDEMMVKTFLLGHIKDPYREKLQDAIEKRVDSYSKSIVKASSGLMHLAREMYRDVTHMETVDVPDEFFDKMFIRQLMPGTEKARKENERVHALHENYAEFRF